MSRLLLLVLTLSLLVLPAVAESRIDQAVDRVYAQFTDLPRLAPPDQPGDTLVLRLVLYHIRVRGRPENSRLDWQFTLADYLGYNLNIDATNYPDGYAALERDKAALDALTRPQRQRLIRLLSSALRR